MADKEELVYIIDKIHQHQQEILKQIEDLKERIETTIISSENSNILQSIPSISGVEDTSDSSEIKNEAHRNLLFLYERGFHVCNDLFGKMREEDCMFCAPFLNIDLRG